MEHPLIQIDPNATVDELQSRISDLNKKLGFATRSGNRALADQIRLALNTFNNQYQQKMREIQDRQSRGNNDYSDRIDIS